MSYSECSVCGNPCAGGYPCDLCDLRARLAESERKCEDMRTALMIADACIFHLDGDLADVNSRVAHAKIEAALSPPAQAEHGAKEPTNG